MENNALGVQGNLTFIPPLLLVPNLWEQAKGDKKARERAGEWETYTAHSPCGGLAPGPYGQPVTLYAQSLQSDKSLSLLWQGPQERRGCVPAKTAPGCGPLKNP